MLILSLLRYTGLQVSSLVEVIGSVIPESLMGTVGELVLSTYENASGALVGVSAFTALWSASKGVYGLLTGLNRVYGVAEDRGWFYTRFISVVYTFALLVVLVLLAALVLGMSADNTRKVTLMKETQAMPAAPEATVMVHGLRYEGELLPLPEPALRIEFIGDSLTSGEGALAPKDNDEWISLWFTACGNYSHYACKALNAERRSRAASSAATAAASFKP